MRCQEKLLENKKLTPEHKKTSPNRTSWRVELPPEEEKAPTITDEREAGRGGSNALYIPLLSAIPDVE